MSRKRFFYSSSPEDQKEMSNLKRFADQFELGWHEAKAKGKAPGTVRVIIKGSKKTIAKLDAFEYLEL